MVAAQPRSMGRCWGGTVTGTRRGARTAGRSSCTPGGCPRRAGGGAGWSPHSDTQVVISLFAQQTALAMAVSPVLGLVLGLALLASARAVKDMQLSHQGRRLTATESNPDHTLAQVRPPLHAPDAPRGCVIMPASPGITTGGCGARACVASGGLLIDRDRRGLPAWSQAADPSPRPRVH
jgi:hypothetical protein